MRLRVIAELDQIPTRPPSQIIQPSLPPLPTDRLPLAELIQRLADYAEAAYKTNQRLGPIINAMAQTISGYSQDQCIKLCRMVKSDSYHPAEIAKMIIAMATEGEYDRRGHLVGDREFLRNVREAKRLRLAKRSRV